MSCLKWVQVDADFPASAPVGYVARELALSRQAVVGLMVDVWLWAGANAVDGLVRGPHAAVDLEEAAKWSGESGRLVSALCAAPLLEMVDGGFRLLGWDRYAGLLKKRVRDAERKRLLREGQESAASVGAALSSAPAECRADGAATARGNPGDGARTARAPLPLLSPSLSSKGVQGESAPGSLLDRIAAAFTAARGQPYQPTRSEEEALRALLSLARGDEDEVVRRWSIGLGWQGYPGCSSLQELKQERCWGRFTAPQQAPPGARGRPQQANGYVKTDTREWTEEESNGVF